MTVESLRRRIVLDAGAVPAALGAAAVLAQVSYPLVHGVLRDRLTVLIVLLFAAASVAHAAVAWGRRCAGLLVAATAGIGLLVEIVGVHTGFPFGRYQYTGGLGVQVFGVPLLIAFAWTMLAWPAALVARRLVAGFGARVLVGAWALAAWDLFLDPQMVAAGHWRWQFTNAHLPGVDTVPLTNYAGWLAVSAGLSLVLQGMLRGGAIGGRAVRAAAVHVDAVGVDAVGVDAVPIALYLWTYASSVLALAAFLGLAWAACWGALGMGVIAVPLAMSLLAGRPAR